MSPQQIIDTINKKIGIFEIRKHQKIYCNTQCYQQFFYKIPFAVVDSFANEEINQCGKNQQKEKEPAGFVIEEKTYQKEIGASNGFILVKNGIEQQDNGIKNPKIQLGENQWSIIVKQKNLFYVWQ
jgi:hypothetical protein